MSRKSRYRISCLPSTRMVNTSVAGTGVEPSAIWNRPPNIGLITSQRSEPPAPSSVPKTRCLPRRISETIRRAGSSLAKFSTGYRSMWPFLGLTVAAVITFPSSRGARRMRSASSSGSSGMNPRYGLGFTTEGEGQPQSMKLHRFTEKAQEALQEAAELARSLGQQAVEPEHLLLALVRQEEGVGRTLLEGAGVSVQALEPALD